jgi:hypothetical protein
VDAARTMAREAGIQTLRKAPNMQHQTLKVEHGSPIDVIEAARKVLGVIDLDPASSKLFNTVVKAGLYYTEKTDGLKQPWFGRVFLNPPGCPIVPCPAKCTKREEHTHRGPSLAPLFWSKLIEEYTADRVASAIYVCFSLEQLQNFQSLKTPPTRFPFCIPRSRLPFLHEVDGRLVPQTSPTHANALIYLPPVATKTWVSGSDGVGSFVRVFQSFGEVVVPNRLAVWRR